MAQFQKNFSVSGAATTELVAADATPLTCKVRELRLWVSGPGSFRISDGTTVILQGVAGANVGAPDGGNMEIGMASQSASTYVLVCQGSNRPLQLITAGATAQFGGSIQYDLV
jgi:hypothetical protein